ncbi:MAG: cell division protein FtsQ/DivIB [Burkholderiaceae bacterium]|jgi:cell division protein FtsQ|nr:cell division protein FtsQ/DivIB [Burkholderiaceae bacterium]
MSALAGRFQPVIPAPFDVRLMNATSALLLTAVLLAVCAAGLWGGLRNPAFAIRRIVVHGQTAHNDPASLDAYVLPHLSGNFFTLSMAQAQAAFQSAPWVERAVVWRRWPGLLDVALQEHKPYAYWGASGARMIDVSGQLFDTGTANGTGNPGSATLPTLMGPDGQSAVVLTMYGKLAPLVTPLHARLAALQLQDRGSWRVLLAGDPSSENAADATLDALIELGSGTPDELAARLQTFVATAPQVTARHQRGVADIETADLGYPNGYALRLRGVTTTDGKHGAAAAVTQPAPRHGAATRAKQ